MNSIFEDFGVALVMMIVAALIGALIVYLWFRNRYTRLEERNNQLSGEASELKSRFGALEDQFKIAEQKAQDCSGQIEPIRLSLDAREKELKAAQASAEAMKKEVAALTPYKVEFEDLQVRYQALEDSVKELQGKAAPKKPVAEKPVSASPDTSAVAEELAREKAVRLSMQEQLEGLRPFRQKYEELKVKYDALVADKGPETPASRSIAAVPEPKPEPKKEAAPAPKQEAPAKPEPAKTEKPKAEEPKKKESQEETLARIQERAKEINFDRIGVATADAKDDLKRVKGIGPFIEKKLNSIGIYTFRQIAAFNAEDEDKVNEVIEFFPGRIRRDEWAKQAGELAKEKEEESEKKD